MAAPARGFYGELAEACATWHGAMEAPDRVAALARVARGEPALALDVLEIDWEAARRIALAICDAGERHHPTIAGTFIELRAWLRDLPVDPLRRLLRAHLTGAPQDGVLGVVLTEAVRPALHVLAEALGPVVEAAASGPRCPACGGVPDFAALEPDAGARRLLCSRCDTEWQWQRTGCPYCKSEAPESVGYFEIGESPTYRLYVCGDCRTYLKTIDLRQIWQARSLPIERVRTIGMDLAALQAGYSPSPSR